MIDRNQTILDAFKCLDVESPAQSDQEYRDRQRLLTHLIRSGANPTDRQTSLALTQHQMRLIREAVLIAAVDAIGMANDARKKMYFAHAAELMERNDAMRTIAGKIDHALDPEGA